MGTGADRHADGDAVDSPALMEEDGAGDDAEVVHERRQGGPEEPLVGVQDAGSEAANGEDDGRDEHDPHEAGGELLELVVAPRHDDAHDRAGEDGQEEGDDAG